MNNNNRNISPLKLSGTFNINIEGLQCILHSLINAGNSSATPPSTDERVPRSAAPTSRPSAPSTRHPSSNASRSSYRQENNVSDNSDSGEPPF